MRRKKLEFVIVSDKSIDYEDFCNNESLINKLNSIEELDHKIGNELDEIVNQVTDAVLTKREHIVLQKVIEKQKAKLEDFEELFSILEEYYSITREDLEKIIKEDR